MPKEMRPTIWEIEKRSLLLEPLSIDELRYADAVLNSPTALERIAAYGIILRSSKEDFAHRKVLLLIEETCREPIPADSRFHPSLVFVLQFLSDTELLGSSAARDFAYRAVISANRGCRTNIIRILERLSRLGDVTAHELLRNASHDPESDVRYNAEGSLRRLQSSDT